MSWFGWPSDRRLRCGWDRALGAGRTLAVVWKVNEERRRYASVLRRVTTQLAEEGDVVSWVWCGQLLKVRMCWRLQSLRHTLRMNG